MAKRGFKVLDSDLHTMEPDDLWSRYLEPRFRPFAPTFARRAEGPPNQPTIVAQGGALTIGEMTKRDTSVRAGADLHRRSFARHRPLLWPVRAPLSALRIRSPRERP